MRDTYKSDDVPTTRGPYSAVTRIDNQVFVSGQLGVDTAGLLAETFSEQMHLAMQNLMNSLAVAGAVETDIAHINIYLVRRDDFETMNTIYREYFSSPYPSRTTIEAGLSPGVLFEINAQAILASNRQ